MTKTCSASRTGLLKLKKGLHNKNIIQLQKATNVTILFETNDTNHAVNPFREGGVKTFRLSVKRHSRDEVESKKGRMYLQVTIIIVSGY